MDQRLPIFVYGTLMSGEINHDALLSGHILRIEEAAVDGRLFFVAEGAYPYALFGCGRILGELIRLRPESYDPCLRALDCLEDYEAAQEAESLYLRRTTLVRTRTGEDLEAWIYWWNAKEDEGVPIESGSFREFMRHPSGARQGSPLTDASYSCLCSFEGSCSP